MTDYWKQKLVEFADATGHMGYSEYEEYICTLLHIRPWREKYDLLFDKTIRYFPSQLGIKIKLYYEG